MFGMDTMMMILLLYLMIGDSGAALSVDRWLERRRARGRPADQALKPSWSANFAIRLVQIHFCIIYLVSGASKLLGLILVGRYGPVVVPGQLQLRPDARGRLRAMLVFLCQNFRLWQIVLTASVIFTLFTETCFTFLVWNKKWRPVMVSCSVFLHLGIGLIMGLVVFSLFMLTMVLAFVPPDVIRVYLDRIGGWFRSSSGRRRRRRRDHAPAKELADSPVRQRRAGGQGRPLAARSWPRTSAIPFHVLHFLLKSETVLAVCRTEQHNNPTTVPSPHELGQSCLPVRMHGSGQKFRPHDPPRKPAPRHG